MAPPAASSPGIELSSPVLSPRFAEGGRSTGKGAAMTDLEGFTLDKDQPTDQDDRNRQSLESILTSFRSDSRLRSFLADDFVAEEQVERALREGTLAKSLQDTDGATNLLSGHVRAEVIRRQDALLREVEAVSALEQQINGLSRGLDGLAMSTGALADELLTPSEMIRRAVRKINNTRQAASLLLRLERFRHASHRLQQLLRETANATTTGERPTASTSFDVHGRTSQALSSAAVFVRDLEELLDDRALENVDVVRAELPHIRRALAECRRRTSELLRDGLDQGDHGMISAAVVALATMGILGDSIKAENARLTSAVHTAIVDGFDTSHVSAQRDVLGLRGSFGGTNGGSTSATANGGGGGVAASVGGAKATARGGAGSVWVRIDEALARLHDLCALSVQLQIILQRKHHPYTYKPLSEALPSPNFPQALVLSVIGQLGAHIESLSRANKHSPSAQMFEALSEDYPHFLSQMTDFVQRVCRAGSGISALGAIPQTAIIDRQTVTTALNSVLQPCEQHYLAESLTRITDPIESVFNSDGSLPGEPVANGLLNLFTAEIAACREHGPLAVHAAKKIAAALYMYTAKAQEAVTSGKYPLAALANLSNGLLVLSSSAKVMFGLPMDTVSEVLEASLTMKALSQSVINRPFLQVQEELEELLLGLHESTASTPAGGDGQLWVARAAGERLHAFQASFHSRLRSSAALSQNIRTLIQSTLDYALLQAALVWPLDDLRRQKLHSELQALGEALRGIAPRADLGSSYSAFQSFQMLLNLPSNQLTEDNLGTKGILQSVSASRLTLHILGRASSPLVPPQRRLNWSSKEAAEWIRQHTELEIWEKVVDSLDAYEKVTGSAGGKSAASAVYVLLRELGPKLLEGRVFAETTKSEDVPLRD